MGTLFRPTSYLPYLLVFAYFWLNWTVKLALSLCYKPYHDSYDVPVTIVMPIYNEDKDFLREALTRILAQPVTRVQEFIVVMDKREPELPDWLESTFPDEPRLNVVVGSNPGKRHSVRLGIEMSETDLVIAVDSDVLIREDSFDELIRPFVDPRVGGAVGDQEVYEPHHNAWTFLNFICEKAKYMMLYPALGMGGQVTVLAGRAAAYRHEAALPLLDRLTNETYLGRTCISGDDGRITSLLFHAGWKTCFQSTSIVESVAPPSFKGLVRQRIRWYRNSARRTLRALFWDGMWVWRYPLATWQMLTTWVNTLVVALAMCLLVNSILTGHFFWFGQETLDVLSRLALLTVGLVLTRIIRVYPALKRVYESKPGWRWWLFALLPFYLLLFWIVRVCGILTLNKQGWVTRASPSLGGLG